jgi:hypothetical protein
MNQLRLLIFLSFITSVTLAQTPADKLTKWGTDHPVEKVYLHLDREDYVPGQTLWFKAYLSAATQASELSTTLYVELVTPGARIVAKRVAPIINGVTQGQIELPDTLTSGRYFIRAFTPIMLNQDASFIFQKPVFITGAKAGLVPTDLVKNETRLEFFPEGGNFITGQTNTIAFKATDMAGFPVNVAGVIRNTEGTDITRFSSYHDGMGTFDIDAVNGATYYAVLSDNNNKQYPLPQSIEKGIVFSLLKRPDAIHFDIRQKKGDPVLNAAYMIGQMQHQVVFVQPFKEGVEKLGGIIKTNNLRSGILHITVFNKAGLPLAERLSFVDNKEYILQAELKADTLRLSPSARNRYSIAFADTVVGSFSISITDADYNISPVMENIISRFLLTGDLNGYIHHPSYYFSTGVNPDSAAYALDLVMMTNGWRRFRWTQILGDSSTASKFRDPGYINLSGKVTLEGTNKPFSDREMMMMVVSADSSKSMQLVKTDAAGYYKADSLVYFGKATILLSDIRGKKSRFVDIKPSPDSLNRSFQFKSSFDQFPYQPVFSTEASRRFGIEYDALQKAQGIILSEIVVKSKKKTALELLEERYTSGAFQGDSRQTFDLLSTNEASAYSNIFDFLQMKVPGIAAGRTETGDYFVYFRQMSTLSSLGNQQMDIFLDEIPSDASTIAFIPPDQIAMVKVFSNFVGSSGGGAGGALAIYLKKGADYTNSLPSAGQVYTSNGFSVIREFYSPNYSIPQRDVVTPDQRLTLYWKPDLFISAVNPRVPFHFYNNDRTGRIRVIIEGMTVDGKLLYIEKKY